MSDNVIYSELYTPFFKAFVFFMPMFYTYGITIQEKNTNNNKGVNNLWIWLGWSKWYYCAHDIFTKY